MRVFMQTTPPASPLRFYQLVLQRDLLGGWSLVRQYGVAGNKGVQHQQHFDDIESAQEELVRYRDAQIKKGFKIMFIHGDEVQQER